MGEQRYSQILAEGFVQALPWAIMFSVTFLVTLKVSMVMVKPEIKKAVEYVVETGVNSSMEVVLSQEVFPKIKQNTKEAIEYTVNMVDDRLIAPHMKRESARK
ncbi:MAG: hypothetical protein HY581_05135 [Nitrospirae bacterium]|nr:hypothetical protein [Nitrospirota bacterium]